MTTFASAIAILVTSLAVVSATSASGACRKTLRGELVQSPGRPLASPHKVHVYLTGEKKVRLDQFERIPVYGSWSSF
jgi:hypothetical protein